MQTHPHSHVSREFLNRLTSRDTAVPKGSAAAMSGSMAASVARSLCEIGLSHATGEKALDELRTLRRKTLSMQRDLIALIETDVEASRRVAAVRNPQTEAGLKALLFAAEVPLRTAETCQALLTLTLRALGRVGIKGIAEVGTATALAYGGVIGGVLTARSWLAAIPANSGTGADAARKRAESIMREAEALRTQIIERVRHHLP